MNNNRPKLDMLINYRNNLCRSIQMLMPTRISSKTSRALVREFRVVIMIKTIPMIWKKMNMT